MQLSVKKSVKWRNQILILIRLQLKKSYFFYICFEGRLTKQRGNVDIISHMRIVYFGLDKQK